MAYELFSYFHHHLSESAPHGSGHPSHWAAAVHNLGDTVPALNLRNLPAPMSLSTSLSSPSNGIPVALPPHMSTMKIGSMGAPFGQFSQFEGTPFGSPNVQHHMPPFHPNSLPEFNSASVNPLHSAHSPGLTTSSFRAHDGAEVSYLQRSANSGNVNALVFDQGLGVGGVSGGLSISNDNGVPRASRQFVWGGSSPYSHHVQDSPPVIWPSTSTSNTYNHVSRAPAQPNPFAGAHGRLADTIFSVRHHVGSAPTGEISGLDIPHGYFAESPSTPSLIRTGSVGGAAVGSHATHPLNINASHGLVNFVPVPKGGGIDYGASSAGLEFMSPQQRARFFSNSVPPIVFMNSMDGMHDRVRNRRVDISSTQADNKKQYQLDIDRILRGEDPRTTLMIKNIPNKYNAKMLLAAIDERHRGAYDFIYLPIDFKNKCNVGYAFINMVDPSKIVPFYEDFHGKKWEKFNSEKVASLAYGRIQGKAALIAHFQNSSLMNEDKRCRPILFQTEGPNVGDQEPFPVAINIRTRSTRDQNINGNALPGSPSDSSSSSSKDEPNLGSEN